MIEKQKQAIKILNQLRWDNVINENDYFLLLEFIVGSNEPQVTTYVPYIQTDPQPLDPVYGKFGRVTCGQTTLMEKEEQQ